MATTLSLLPSSLKFNFPSTMSFKFKHQFAKKTASHTYVQHEKNSKPYKYVQQEKNSNPYTCLHYSKGKFSKPYICPYYNKMKIQQATHVFITIQ